MRSISAGDLRSSGTGNRERRIQGRCRLGSATVEFALMAPIIAMLVYGMIEMTRGMMVKEVLSNAARKGCNTGIKPGKINTDMTTDVNNILSDNSINPASATITILVRDLPYDANNPPKAMDKMSVQVSVPVSAVFWGGTILLTGQTIESELVVMMRQG